MKRSAIQRIIFIAIIAIIGFIATQFYLINTARGIQQKELNRQFRQDSLNTQEFNDKVKTALTNVAQQILTINDDPAQLYKAVEQLRPNYFVVRINDTLHPYLLEQLLKREFDRNNIDESYRYGIYDCFNDSIVYQNLVTENEAEISSEELADAPQIKWNTDGHYFSVTFPNKENIESDLVIQNINPWIIMATLAVIIIMSILAYTVYIILKQKRLSETKTDFINNMTHELKTPIATISLSSEVLLKPEVQKDEMRIQRYASIIHEENTRLQNQVERVLQIAKLDRDEVKLELSEVDVHAIIKSAVSHQELRLQHANGNIEIKLEAKAPIVKGDKVHLNNIINNLIDNAIKYSPEKPQILIHSENITGGIRVSFRDNGIGINKEYQKHIFDKFYRVPTGNLHDVKGFGLGLYYVKELIKRHNGKIEFSSEPDRGSTFTIFIPQNN